MAAGTALPILVPPLPEQRFGCHGCGHCCREPVLHLTLDDKRSIDEQEWAEKLDPPPYVRLGRSWVLNQVPGRGCVFLQDDGKCRIHVEYGLSAKPLGCQLFPFVLLPVKDGWQLSYRFDCPSVVRSRGEAVSTHLPALKHLVRRLPHTRDVGEVIYFQKGRPVTEEGAECLIDSLDAWIADSSRSVRVRLRGLANIAETLGSIKAGKVRDERFVELINLLFQALDSELDHDAPQAPTPRQEKVLQQQVFTHCESIRLSEALGGWRAKVGRMLSQFFRGRRFTTFEGRTPPTQVTDKAIPFATIRAVAPTGKDSTEVEELVVRYLRGQILSRNFYGPHFYGWDFVLGLQSLVSRLAVWGWLARYCAAAEDKTEIDYDSAVRSIGLIAQAAGISQALGSRTERLRLSYLQMDNGMERLIEAYPLSSIH